MSEVKQYTLTLVQNGFSNQGLVSTSSHPELAKFRNHEVSIESHVDSRLPLVNSIIKTSDGKAYLARKAHTGVATVTNEYTIFEL